MKKAALIIISVICALMIHTKCNSQEIDNVYLWLDAWTVHSGSDDLNEHQHLIGFCIDMLCYADFINSFNENGYSFWLNHVFYDADQFIFGMRYGMIYGYDFSPMAYLMPYLGIGNEYVFVETTVIPALDGSNEYMAIVMLRLTLFER